MRYNWFTAIFFLSTAFVLSGCSMVYDAYLRNFSKEKAIVDVYIYDKKWMKTLPNQVHIANEIVAFKSGFRNKIHETQLVRWIDTSHFQFDLMPNSTADFSDMAGKFLNGGTFNKLLVIVTANNKPDTLLNRSWYSYAKKFSYKRRFFSREILYYDVK